MISLETAASENHHRHDDALLQSGLSILLYWLPMIVLNNSGVRASGLGDGALRGPHHSHALRSQAKAVQLHLRKSDSGQGAICNEGTR